MPKKRIWSRHWEDPLEEEMATHSSILAWEMPWTDEPGRLQCLGLKELDMTEACTHTSVLLFINNLAEVISFLSQCLLAAIYFKSRSQWLSTLDHLGMLEQCVSIWWRGNRLFYMKYLLLRNSLLMLMCFQFCGLKFVWLHFTLHILDFFFFFFI